MRKKNLTLAGIIVTALPDNPTHDTTTDTTNAEQEEFTYIPASDETSHKGVINNTEGEKDETKKVANENKSTKKETSTTNNTTFPFANDGSFLEQMKKRLAAESLAMNGDQDDGDDDEARPNKRQET